MVALVVSITCENTNKLKNKMDSNNIIFFIMNTNLINLKISSIEMFFIFKTNSLQLHCLFTTLGYLLLCVTENSTVLVFCLLLEGFDCPNSSNTASLDITLVKPNDNHHYLF